MPAFLDLHRPGEPLLMPNAWDAGSARILASLGYAALATTSSGFAATLGRPDGTVGRDEAIEHAAALVRATTVPVSADLEDGYAADEAGVAETVRLAAGAGLAGCSIEDWSGTALHRGGRRRRPRRRRGGRGGRRASSSRAAPRTTSAASTISATRSRGSRPTRRPARTCSTRRD